MSTRKRWVTPTFNTLSSNEPVAKKRSAPAAKRSKRAPPPSLKVNGDKSQTWLDKYQPETPEDLVIHPKKVKEVEDWFGNYLSNGTEKYLLLHGPCGCGKSTTLRVLAKHFKFDIIEWITPLDREYDPEDYQSAGEIFDNFVSRATRYPSLLSLTAHKLILIKDFPNVFLQNAESFHDLIRKYLKVSTYPIVFVCNDDQQTRNLFPDPLRQECTFRTINFNAVTSRTMVKLLQRVLDVELKSNAGHLVATGDLNLDHICRSSAGDIRSAILKLYFSAVKGVSEEADAVVHVEGSKADRHQNQNKDEAIDLFHMLGRVLYSSRIPSTTREGYTFKHNPHHIADCVSMQPSSFVGFLQENYLSRFSSLEDVAAAANTLSYTDILLAQYNKETNVAALAVVTTGLMVANSNPVRSFKPFVKPQFREDVSIANIRNEVGRTFNSFQHSPGDIILYTLPLLSKSNYLFEEGEQRRVACKLANVFRK